jgi:hypothetical protein
MRRLKMTNQAMLHLKYKEDHPHVQRARRSCCLLALALKWYRVRLMTLFLNECAYKSERKSIEWIYLSYVYSFRILLINLTYFFMAKSILYRGTTPKGRARLETFWK